MGGETTDDALEHQQQLPTPAPSEEDTTRMVPEGYRQRGEKAPQDVNLDPTDTSLIVSGKRTRKPRDLNNFAVQVYAARLGPKPLDDYLRAFSTEILTKRASASADEVPRIHQSQLLASKTQQQQCRIATTSTNIMATITPRGRPTITPTTSHPHCKTTYTSR